MKRCVILSLTLLASAQSLAWKWQDLWSTSDQQGQHLIEQGQYAKAKKTFTRQDWIATAAYKSGDYQRAADLFKEFKTDQGYYNQGNALS